MVILTTNPLEYEMESTIIMNGELLTLESIPEQIFHRKKQIDEIAHLLRQPLKKNPMPPKNMVIKGRPGVGKTVVMQKMLKHLKDKCNKDGIRDVKSFYINCSKARTAMTIVKKLCRKVKINRKSQDTEELLSEFFTKIDKELKCVIIVLDEIDKLKSASDINWIIHYVVRAREGGEDASLTNTHIGLICIVNNIRFTENLDVSTFESVGRLSELMFQPYTEKQLEDILEARANITLRKRAITKNLINYIARYAKDIGGGARTAIELLRESALIAEKECLKKIELRHVEKAKKKIESRSIYKVLRDLSRHEKWAYLSLCLVHDLTKENTKINEVKDTKNKEYLTAQTSTLYQVYKKLLISYGGNQSPVTDRQFRRYFYETFKKQGLIESISYGRTSIHVPTLNPTSVKEILFKQLGRTKEELDKLAPENIINNLKENEQIRAKELVKHDAKEIEEISNRKPVD